MIFPTAPRARVLTPALFPGMQAQLVLELETDREMKIEYANVDVRCVQGWQVGSGKNAVTAQVTTRLLGSQLLREHTLHHGITQLPFELALPADMPPTHDMEPGYIRLEVRSRVGIPWWIDGRDTHYLQVRRAPGPPRPRAPVVWRSFTKYPDDPRIEIGLASSFVAAGERVVGSCALYHMSDRKAREVTIELVGTFTLRGRGRPRTELAVRYKAAELVFEPGTAGESVPFSFPVSKALTPTLSAGTQDLIWSVQARTGGLLSGHVFAVAPIEIGDALAADASGVPLQAPPLTNERVAGAFASFAYQHGWRAIGDDDIASSAAIARAEGDCELRLAYAQRGSEGTVLVSRIIHPSLGLGLSVTPSSVLRHVFIKDVEVDIAAWDRANLVGARFAEQAIPVLRAAVPALMEAAALGTMVQWTDRAIVFELHVLAVDAANLTFAEAMLARVAAAIGAARELATLPPGCQADAAAWRELAASLHGQLALGDLSVDGARGDVPVHLGLDFDDAGHAVAVHASVGDPEHAGELVRAMRVDHAAPALDAASGPLPEGARELVARWPVDFVELHVANGVVAAAWRLPEAVPRVIDHARARQLVDALHGLLAALAPDAGPYR